MVDYPRMIRLLTVFLCICCVTPSMAQEKAPTTSNTKKLLKSYYELETTAEEKENIIRQLALIDLSKASLWRKWLKQMQKDAKDSISELPKEKGEYFFWPETKQGFYIIAGETEKPKGLMIGMHGGGVGSGDAHAAAGAMKNAGKELGWLSIFPEVIEKTEHGWTDSGTEEWVMQLVDMAIATYEIDPDHIYLSGHSMGGYGSWTLGAHHADRIAAIAPSAGAPSPVYNYDGEIIEIQSGVVPNLRNLPAVVFQSTDDPRVPADANQAAVKIVEQMKKRWGGYENFKYWEVHDRGHGYPEGGMISLLSKIKDFKRNVHPKKIVWQPTLEWKKQFYSLNWPTPRLESIVLADFNAENNSFDIQSDANLSGFELMLSPDMVAIDKEITVSLNGKEVLKHTPQPNLGYLLKHYSHADSNRIYADKITLP